MKNGWLINDKLTCIPGTKTFWHDLLENIDGLENHCVYPFGLLKPVIEVQLGISEPDYIIRNATFFPHIESKAKTIAFLQDIYENNHIRNMQDYVLSKSDVVVFNSKYTASKYQTEKHEIIPIGVDSERFTSWKYTYRHLQPILFVGDDSVYPKGFDKLMEIVNSCESDFIFVMKNDFKINHPRIKVYNKISDIELIHRNCSMLICTSVVETQHLGGVEAGFSGLPILAPNTGVYYNNPGEWGLICDSVRDYLNGMREIRTNFNKFNPRDAFLKMGLDKKSCMDKWKKLVESV